MPMTGPHSDETKAKMAAAHKAQWADPEFRAKMKAAHARRSPEERKANAKKAGEAASKVLKGKKRDPEQFKKAVATRRARMGGKYMPGQRFITPPPPLSDDLPKLPKAPESEPVEPQKLRRKQTPEHIAARVASRIRNNGGQYLTPEQGEVFRQATRGRVMPEEQKKKISKAKKGRGRPHVEETKRKISEAKKKQWADGVYANKKPASRRRVSQMELALVPFLEALGYQHVDARNKFYIHTPGKGMVPDFVDRKGKRVFEYFGGFWHHPDDEVTWVEQYRLVGWDCTVLWECDASQWVEEHRHLVTEEQYDLVRRLIEHGLFPHRGNPEMRTSTV